MSIIDKQISTTYTEQRSTGDTELDRTEIFELLSSRRRRYVISACQQLDPPLEVGDLAESVAAWECEKPVKAVTAEERRRVYTSLQQTHLPRLDDVGIIEYERGTVTDVDGIEGLEVYLEVVPEDEIPWAQYYCGLTGVAAGVIAGAGLGIYPDWIPNLMWATLVVAVFGLSAVVHLLYTRRSRLGTKGPPPEVNMNE